MKKKEKYYAVNNQEDEDGYTLYPDNAIAGENIKRKKEISPSSLSATTGIMKQEQRNFVLSPAATTAK